MPNVTQSTLLLAVALASVGTSPAQEESALKARNFFFQDYRTVTTLNMKALRDTGVWDELNIMTLRLLMPMLEEQFGFPLDRLDRLVSVRAQLTLDNGVKQYGDVTVLEGNGDLGQPGEVRRGEWVAERIGTYTIHRSQWSDSKAVVAVNSTMRVYGTAERLREVLSGKARAGRPCADVMSFTGRRNDALLSFVADLQAEDDPREMMRLILPGQEWPEGDEPTFACGRVKATGDEDDPHLQFELILRHRTDGEGLAATEAAVTAKIAELTKMPEARLFRSMLGRIEHRREGIDAIWRVDLGRAREFGGLLGTLTPFMALRAVPEPMPVGAVPVPKPGKVEVVEEEPPKKGKQGKGK